MLIDADAGRRHHGTEAVALLRGGRRGAAFRARGEAPVHLAAGAELRHPQVRGRARRAAVLAHQQDGRADQRGRGAARRSAPAAAAGGRSRAPDGALRIGARGPAADRLRPLDAVSRAARRRAALRGRLSGRRGRAERDEHARAGTGDPAWPDRSRLCALGPLPARGGIGARLCGAVRVLPAGRASTGAAQAGRARHARDRTVHPVSARRRTALSRPDHRAVRERGIQSADPSRGAAVADDPVDDRIRDGHRAGAARAAAGEKRPARVPAAEGCVARIAHARAETQRHRRTGGAALCRLRTRVDRCAARARGLSARLANRCLRLFEKICRKGFTSPKISDII
ncbi:hypothetical protein F01_230185 [Burkholderia cenocepacia]|nr:hypothetical protein F01_230185 [Burkholderia cenocepacia]